ncbi:MAG: nucleotidyltransferase domain-containing protein [Rubrivivax sp.]|nr:nucleotidyltransferase domain-containing protein [Rubrivivax sp.]
MPVLSEVHRALVSRILRETLPDPEVYVFGSRSTGRARPFSDLDLLVLRPPRLTLTQRVELRDRFEASVLPFRVDLVEAAGLPAGMAARVLRECRAL